MRDRDVGDGGETADVEVHRTGVARKFSLADVSEVAASGIVDKKAYVSVLGFKKFGESIVALIAGEVKRHYAAGDVRELCSLA